MGGFLCSLETIRLWTREQIVKFWKVKVRVSKPVMTFGMAETCSCKCRLDWCSWSCECLSYYWLCCHYQYHLDVFVARMMTTTLCQKSRAVTSRKRWSSLAGRWPTTTFASTRCLHRLCSRVEASAPTSGKSLTRDDFLRIKEASGYGR